MDKTVTLQFRGKQRAEKPIPDILRRSVRSSTTEYDLFLPESYIKVKDVYDLSSGTRAVAGAAPCDIESPPGTVVLIELADGTTVITSGERLLESLGRSGVAGSIDLSRLQETSSHRGWLGDHVSTVVERITTLAVDESGDAILEEAKKQLAKYLGKKVESFADLGVTWLGTKALMWAVEKRLQQAPGLYRWAEVAEGSSSLAAVSDRELDEAVKAGPLLVFIHGTASSTSGSFSDLRSFATADWQPLAAKFGERIYAFEHRTFSESPIKNAVDLARRLPKGAQLNLVSHSRGGLVADLLCLEYLDDALISHYEVAANAVGAADATERARIATEAKKAYADHRQDLQDLRAVLAEKQFQIQRYVRVACPARGTRLLSGNLDLFLSALLRLIGLVPTLSGNPLYSAVKRIVIEIAKNRTNPMLVPGIEAMLPESPMGRLLAQAQPREKIQMAVITGDVDTRDAGLLKKLGVLFTDYVFFNSVENDFVVDTDSMYAGIAMRAQALARFDSGPQVSHFNYFKKAETRAALHQWLEASEIKTVRDFEPVQNEIDEASRKKLKDRLLDASRSRGDLRAQNTLPIVVVVPGIMGSHLWLNRQDRVWFDPKDLAFGGLERIGWGEKNIEAEELFQRYYGDLCEYLVASHQVETYPYDWRLPLDSLAEQFGNFLTSLLEQTPPRPVRLLAHSMGGLIIRALIYKDPRLMQSLMEREGARVVMLGTPHQGSHSMVETLIGKADSIRTLARVDLEHDLQAVLNIVAGFRGALQLLPRTGFSDTGVSHREIADYFKPNVWQNLKNEMQDFWFGDGVTGLPDASALKEAAWLWDRDATQLEQSDAGNKISMWPKGSYKNLEYLKANTIYVRGLSAKTACGITKASGRWKMLGTDQGDGTVTWASGDIDGIRQSYFLPAEHGALAATEEYYPAIAELLSTGTTAQLATEAPKSRSAAPAAFSYDAGPAPYPTPDDLATPIFGTIRGRVKPKALVLPVLEVGVKAMDLRFVNDPIMVGHYEQDPISGAEAIVDRELLKGMLSDRYNMGMYAGPIGTAVVALSPQNERERQRGSLYGAIVTGLGTLDKGLSSTRLTEAVHTGALRYLLHYADCTGKTAAEIPLSTLLIGYNSSANISIDAAVKALVTGIVSANNKYLEVTRQTLRISRLDIVELYLDTAISASHALHRLARELERSGNAFNVQLRIVPELKYGEGWRHRLDDARVSGYWPRLLIGDSDRRDDAYATDNYMAAGPTGETAGSAAPRTAIAERLRFVHIGQRARAEVIVKQRQPGLVEKLIERQIASPSYDKDFCRTLFQLLVPHEFKDAARQLERIVLVLDGYTANLPWELMLADDTPLAARTEVVRQLASMRFRAHVRQTRFNQAYVIGNPSTEGFCDAFPGVPPSGEGTALTSLTEAEAEATAVVDVLRRYNFQVSKAIGQDRLALDILNPLYKQPYRIVHIAAHGIYDLLHRDGRTRSGVVLSDGLLITAAEIEAMESVPDLVFLNCCYLAKTDATSVAFNRLAYSIARELIEAGVRCVIAAGWPVDDKAAELFAVTFYDALLRGRMAFGEAVYAARKETYRQCPNSMTWGAYQAYGDPGWQIALDGSLDGLSPGDGSPGSSVVEERRYVAPDELIDHLHRIQVKICKQGKILNKTEAEHEVDAVDRLLKREWSGWQDDPRILNALACFYAELGPAYFAQACKCYSQAIALSTKGQVSVNTIEQLANLEARDGELRDELAVVDRAITRLRNLILSIPNEADPKVTSIASGNAERLSILGSALKSRAAVLAHGIARGEQGSAQDYEKAISESIDAYKQAALTIEDNAFNPYPVLNYLALQSLRKAPKDFPALCDKCIEVANAGYRKAPNFWDAMTAAEAELIRRLSDGTLMHDKNDRLNEIVQCYRDSLEKVRVRPKEMNSVIRQLTLLILFFETEEKLNNDPAKRRVANKLRQLADSLQDYASRAEADTSGNTTVDDQLIAAEDSTTDEKRSSAARGISNSVGAKKKSNKVSQRKADTKKARSKKR